MNDGGDLELPKVKDPKFYQTEEGASWKVLDNIRFMQNQMGLVLHKRMFVVYNSTLLHTVVRNFLEMRDGESGETLQFKFPKEVFDRLPLNEPQFTYRRCAVVGNSGVVLLKEYGKEIDEHDAVFRLNMAPIRGFEDYVGSKTTFNMVNSHNIKEMLAGQRRWRSTDPDSKLVVFETGQDFTRYHLLKELLKNTPLSDPAYLPLENSIRCVQEVARGMNQNMAEKENREKVAQLSAEWYACWFVGVLACWCVLARLHRYLSWLLNFAAPRHLGVLPSMHQLAYLSVKEASLKPIGAEDCVPTHFFCLTICLCTARRGAA